MIIPAPRLLAIAAAWTGLGLIASLWPAARVAWVVGGVLLLVAAALDGWRARRFARTLSVTRLLAPVLPVGRSHPYQVRLLAPHALDVALTFRQGRKAEPQIRATLAAMARLGFLAIHDSGQRFSTLRAA